MMAEKTNVKISYDPRMTPEAAQKLCDDGLLKQLWCDVYKLRFMQFDGKNATLTEMASSSANAAREAVAAYKEAH